MDSTSDISSSPVDAPASDCPQDFAFDYASGIQAMDQEILEIIGQAFLDQWPEDIGKIHEGLNSQESEPILHTAHALKGTLAMFGAEPASELAARMETSARSGNLSDITRLVAPLESEVQSFQAALRACLSD